MKTLFLIISIVLVVWIVRFMLSQNKQVTTKKQKSVEKIVPCAYCGLHVPIDEAVIADQKSYCCADHAEQAKDTE